MTLLRRIRPSNLVILFALPFILWLFAASGDYSRSLSAIVGVEPGSGRLVPGFVLVLAWLATGLGAMRCGPERWALALASLGAAGAIGLGEAAPFAASVLANAVDPFTSALVQQGVSPRVLTDAAAAGLDRALLWSVPALGLLPLAAQALPLRARRWALALSLGPLAAGLALAAHLGFATGLAVTLRAAILAYALAVVLALAWVGLLHLKPARRTLPLFGAAILVCTALAGWQALSPRQSFALVGELSGAIGVVPGTPQALIDTARFGTWPGGDGTERKLLTLKSSAAASQALGAQVSAVLLPTGASPAQAPVLWQTEALPDSTRAAIAALIVLAVVLALFTLGAMVHGRHPASVAAEFLIDTVRGIPMLVIVLYIGLPLAGAVKAGTGGFIDPPNLLRGIVAMALAYSAYLAEIFRAGIKAVPTGQVEAARAMGLTGWQTARLVVLPQALRIVIPPLGNEFIAILKDTSLLSILSIRDVTQRMREFQSASFLPFAPYNSAAILYLLLTLVAASLIASIERKTHVRR